MPVSLQAPVGGPELGTILLEALRGAGTLSKAAGDMPQAGLRHVLLCFGNQKLRGEIAAGFNRDQDEVRTAEDVLGATRAIRDTSIDLLMLDQMFEMEENGYSRMLEHLCSLAPRVRRKMFVVLVTPEYKSLDRNAAFAHQVNLILNPRNVSNFPQLMERGLRDYEEFYRTFHKISARLS